MTFPDRRRRLAVAAGVALASFAAYLATVGSGPHWQDSGLFLAALNVGGGLAPPGYPLYIMLARPFVGALGLVGVPFTVGVHCFSAVLAAITAGLATLTVLLLATPAYSWHARPTGDDAAEPLGGSILTLGAIAGLAVGWSYSLWFQALMAEVYSLNAALSMGVLYILVRLAAEGPLGPDLTRRQVGWCVALCVVWGCSFANHISIVVLVPAVLVWFGAHWRAWRRWPLLVGFLFCFFACGFLPYLYLPVLAHVEPTAQFGWVAEWDGFWSHVWGKRWTAQGRSYGLSADRLAAFPGQLWDELFLVGVVGLALGAAAWARLDRRAAVVMATWAGVSFILPFVYLQGTEYDFWWLPFFGLLQVTAGWGGVVAWRHWSPALADRWHRPVLGAVAILALLPHVLVNWRYVDRRGDFVAEDFGRGLLRDCEPGSIYFGWSDQECSLTRYAHEVAGVRPDVFVLQAPVLPDPWYLDWIRARYPELQVPTQPRLWRNAVDELAMQIIAANQPRPVYGSRKLAQMKLPDGAAWVPVGGLWKLDWNAGAAPPIDPAHWRWDYRNDSPFDRPARAHHAIKRQPQGDDLRDVERLPHLEEIRRFHEQAWLNRGRWHLERGEAGPSIEAFHEALSPLSRRRPDAVWFMAGEAAFQAGRGEVARVWLERVSDAFPDAAKRSLYLGQLAGERTDWAEAGRHYRFVQQRARELWDAAEPMLRGSGRLPPNW